MSREFLKVNVAGYTGKWRIPVTPGSIKTFAKVAELITALFEHHDIDLPELNIKGGASLHALFGMELNDVDISVDKHYLANLCHVLPLYRTYTFGKSKLIIDRISKIPICPGENINYVAISIKHPTNVVINVEIVDNVEYKVDFDINLLKIKFSKIDRYGTLILTQRCLISLVKFCEQKEMICRLFGDAFYEKCAHDKFYCVQTLHRISKGLKKGFKIANVSFDNPENNCVICLSSPTDNAEDDVGCRNINDLHMSKIYIHLCDDARHAICANCFYKFATGDAKKDCPSCRRPADAVSTTLVTPLNPIDECVSILLTHAPFSFAKKHDFKGVRMRQIDLEEEFTQSIHTMEMYLDPMYFTMASGATTVPDATVGLNVTGIRSASGARTRRARRANPYIF